MICGRCLQHASAVSTRATIRQPIATARTLPIRTTTTNLTSRSISLTATRQNATPTDTPASSDPTAAAADAASTTTTTTTTTEAGAGAGANNISTCIEGTVLKGLNYFKNRTDPVALEDSSYPPWLWQCLEVQKKADEEGAEDAGDEFSKSKKQRRLAAKRQRAHEARLIAEGNLEALAPKIPLQHQSINLPANEQGTLEGALVAKDARDELRRAMRRERKAKIKESNYLRSM
ncbi:mitochondrial ribosomal protein L37-domain-containing protein [Xylariaceae sp. FL0255]|nr:mitochondrial ribosomal protein L37-domain-containing protein [Xylariaceae sp. FL0255]